MKQSAISLILLFCFATSSGQEVSKLFFDASNQRVPASKAVYYKIGKRSLVKLMSGEQDTLWVDTVKTYYAALEKLHSKVYFAQGGLLQGDYVEYFENGRLKERGTYNQGRLSRYNYGFYPNGKTQHIFFYVPIEADPFNANRRIFAYWDSLGTQLVKDGEGVCKCYMSATIDDRNLREEGQVKAGVRVGEWSMYQGNKLFNKEMFENGRLVSGVAYTAEGEVPYTTYAVQAEFKGGIQSLGRFLGKTLRYPMSDRKMGIEGQVFVSYIIEKDGTISDAKIVKGISRTADAEALRVILESNGMWVPGRQRGHAVRSRFVMPIRFKLEG